MLHHVHVPSAHGWMDTKVTPCSASVNGAAVSMAVDNVSERCISFPLARCSVMEILDHMADPFC